MSVQRSFISQKAVTSTDHLLLLSYIPSDMGLRDFDFCKDFVTELNKLSFISAIYLSRSEAACVCCVTVSV